MRSSLPHSSRAFAQPDEAPGLHARLPGGDFLGISESIFPHFVPSPPRSFQSSYLLHGLYLFFSRSAAVQVSSRRDAGTFWLDCIFGDLNISSASLR